MNGGELIIGEMDGVQRAVILIAGMLFLSLVIERLLELLKSYYNYLEGKHDWYIFWNKSAEKIQRRLEELEKNPEQYNSSSRLGFGRLKIEGIGYLQGFAISVDALRLHTVKYVAKLIGIVLGISIALSADIDLFYLTDLAIYEEGDPGRFPTWATIFTGVAMGLGAGPLHKIISALEKAKKRRTEAK